MPAGRHEPVSHVVPVLPQRNRLGLPHALAVQPSLVDAGQPAVRGGCGLQLLRRVQPHRCRIRNLPAGPGNHLRRKRRFLGRAGLRLLSEPRGADPGAPQSVHDPVHSLGAVLPAAMGPLAAHHRRAGVRSVLRAERALRLAPRPEAGHDRDTGRRLDRLAESPEMGRVLARTCRSRGLGALYRAARPHPRSRILGSGGRPLHKAPGSARD